MSAILHGFLLGIGLLLSLAATVLLLAFFAVRIVEKARLSEFTLLLFKKYARELFDAEQYEELEQLRPIFEVYEGGKKPDGKLLTGFAIKTEVDTIISDDGRISFDKKKKIIKSTEVK